MFPVTLALILLAQDDYFPMAVGTTWTYKGTIQEQPHEKDFVMKVTKFTNDGFEILVPTIESIGKDRQPLTTSTTQKSTCGVRATSEKEPGLPTLIPLDYPLDPDKTWEGTLGEKGPTYKGKVEKEEEVQVPAGKYTCKKVVIEWKNEDRVTLVTAWMAPGVGPVKVQIEQGDRVQTLELKKFESN